MGQPVGKIRAQANVGQYFDSEANLGQRHRADVEAIQQLRADEGDHLSLWLGAAQFRENVGIEQPVRHGVTLRTRMT